MFACCLCLSQPLFCPFLFPVCLFVCPVSPQVCKADKCVYRNAQTMVSHRKHYHATCSHIHQVKSSRRWRGSGKQKTGISAGWKRERLACRQADGLSAGPVTVQTGVALGVEGKRAVVSCFGCASGRSACLFRFVRLHFSSAGMRDVTLGVLCLLHQGRVVRRNGLRRFFNTIDYMFGL